MASVDTGTNNPNDPNNPNNIPGNINQAGGQTNQPATTGGAGGVTATGAGNVTGQVVGTNNPSQPFQNISSYLAANAPQGQQLAGQVAGTVSAPITEAQTGITNTAADFTKSVNAGYTPENKDLITAVSNNPAYVVAENPDNVTNFLAQLNNKYTGPTDFTQAPGYADLQAQIAAAQAKAANTQNEAGIQTLLKDVEGPTTAGINKLDSLLLNVDPNNLKTIQDAGAAAAGLLPTLNQTAADQNALAATGATTASQTAAEALAALNTARGSESTNLTNEQNSIQDIVNQYNRSVGIINPVVQTISQAISDFFAQNPNLKMPTSGDPMADIRNLTSIVMPELATYASPEDYAQIAALTQLGDTNVSNLPIRADQANLAQTFNIPTALQDAIGKAPGVEQALQTQLGGIGTQLNDVLKPYQDLTAREATRADLRSQLDAASNTVKMLQQQQERGGALTPDQQNQLAAAEAQQKAIYDKAAAAGIPAGDLFGSYWPQIAQLANSLQWVNGAETSYQQLVDAINAQLGKLGDVGAPTLSYAPSAMKSEAATGAPIGIQNPKETADLIGTLIGTGVPAATAAGLMAAAPPLTASALAGETAGTVAGQIPAAGLTTLQSVAPAGIAAYGTSNIIKNELANPIRGGLETLANMGLTLATMSLPPQIFTSIGKSINSVINSIGDFFGNLF